MDRKPNKTGNLEITAGPSLPETQDLSFLETVLEDLQDEVYVYDCDTLRFYYVNKAARDHLGWTVEETRSKCIHDTVATFDTNAFYRKTAPLLDGREDMLIVELTYP